MSEDLLNAIKNNPSDALSLFMSALEDFEANFTYNRAFKKIDYHSTNRFKTEEHGYTIQSIEANNIEEKISSAIRDEIENNLNKFLAFLTNPFSRIYKICCKLDDCYTIISTMGEYHCQASNYYEFTIRKTGIGKDGYSGFCVAEFNPIINLEKFLSKAKNIINSPIDKVHLRDYADATAIVTRLAVQYSMHPITADESAQLLALATDSLKRITNCGETNNNKVYAIFSTTYQEIVKAYIKIGQIESAESVLAYFTQFNLQSYFAFFSPFEEVVRQFYFNSVEIAKIYNNKPSVIEFARTCFEYIDNDAHLKAKHIFRLQDYMIEHVEIKQITGERYMDLAVSTLEFMLHFIVVIGDDWSNCVINFINKQLDSFKESPEDLVFLVGNYETRIAMFNKKFSGKYSKLNKLEKKLSQLCCELSDELGDDFKNLPHDYPIDVNGNFFNMVNRKKPWIKPQFFL